MEHLKVTESAAAKARQLLERADRAGDALRVQVVNGGCSGMRYELLFDAEVREGDHEFEQHGLRVLVDAESAGFLENTTVDFEDGLNDSGFKVANPKATVTCGCGESFSL